MIPILNRIAPKMGPDAYQTYAISRPASTHSRVASCAEVECPNRERGWRTTIHLNTPAGQEQARYIKHHAGRAYTIAEQRDGVVVLEFAAGQDCFTEHLVPLEREPLFLLRGGDWRGNPTGAPSRQLSAQAWADDFGEHQETLSELAQKG